MKKISLRLLPLFAAIVVLILVLPSACTHAPDEDASGVGLDTQFIKDKELIASLGYDVSELVRSDTCYLVEKDICLTDSQLESIRNMPKTRHQYNAWPNTVDKTYWNIKVCTQGATSYENEIVRNALNYWNETIKCGLYFSWSDLGGDITINFYANSNPKGNLGEATPPTMDSRPGRSITIYNDTDAYFFAQNDKKMYLIVHMLGHTVGFDHTPATQAEYFGGSLNYHIPGTIEWDAKSIMVKPGTTITWTGASNNDKTAFRHVYQPYEPQFYTSWSPYDEHFELNKPYTLRAFYKDDPKCPNPQFKFEVSSSGTAPGYSVNGNELKITFLAHGTYQIKTTVTNVTPAKEETQTIAIYDLEPQFKVTPDEAFEIGKNYRFTVLYDNPDAGPNPIFNFTAKETKFGNKAQITRVDNYTADIVFPAAGRYEITGKLSSNASKFAKRTCYVEDKEIALTCPDTEFANGHIYYFTARYFSEAHPDPVFKFTITDPTGASSFFGFEGDDKNRIYTIFKQVGRYTVRVEIDGAPELYKELICDVKQDLPALDFGTTPKKLYPSMRVAFRLKWQGLTLYDGDQVKVEILDNETHEFVPFNYDSSTYGYYFFTNGPTIYLIRIYSIENPSVQQIYKLPVLPGVHLKLVATGGNQYDENTYIKFNNIHFYADRDHHQRIDLPYDMSIRVHLFKKAAELFPGSHSIYRDETFTVSKGWPDIQRERLTTVHETLPSGETRDDYYEIEVIKVYDNK